MKKLEIIEELEEALESTEQFILKAEGKKSVCAVKNLEDSPLYIKTWIRYRIERALKLLKD